MWHKVWLDLSRQLHTIIDNDISIKWHREYLVTAVWRHQSLQSAVRGAGVESVGRQTLLSRHDH